MRHLTLILIGFLTINLINAQEVDLSNKWINSIETSSGFNDFDKDKFDNLDFSSILSNQLRFVHIPLYIRSRFPVISVHCLFKNGIVNVKLILFSQTLSFQLESDRFMHNPVEACLCNQFISNHVIPVGNRKLTRDYQ